VLIRRTEAPSLVIAAGRLVVASLVLAPFFARQFPNERKILRQYWPMVGLAGLFLALHFAAWVESLRHTTVASSVVLVAMDPIFVAAVSPLLLRERISWRLGLAVGLGFLGMVIIGLQGLSAGAALKGNLLALAGALCAAGYLVVGRKVRPKLSLVTYVFLMYSVAAVLLAFAVLVSGPKLARIPGTAWLFIVLLGLGPQLVGHTSFNWALRYLAAPAVAMGILFEPVGATILAWLILGEAPLALEVAGGVVICCGIYLAMTDLPRPAEAEPAG